MRQAFLRAKFSFLTRSDNRQNLSWSHHVIHRSPANRQLFAAAGTQRDYSLETLSLMTHGSSSSVVDCLLFPTVYNIDCLGGRGFCFFRKAAHFFATFYGIVCKTLKLVSTGGHATSALACASAQMSLTIQIRTRVVATANSLKRLCQVLEW